MALLAYAGPRHRMGTLKILRKMLQSGCLPGPCLLGPQGGGAGYDARPQQTLITQAGSCLIPQSFLSKEGCQHPLTLFSLFLLDLKNLRVEGDSEITYFSTSNKDKNGLAH